VLRNHVSKILILRKKQRT